MPAGKKTIINKENDTTIVYVCALEYECFHHKSGSRQMI
jgi:hypothetical protein